MASHEQAGQLERQVQLACRGAEREVVDERQHVVGARLREGGQAAPVREGGLRGTPGIHGVADVAERRHVGGHPRPGRLRHRRQVQAGARGQVRDERALPGRDGDHGRPASTDATAHGPGAADQGGRLEQVVEVVAADDAGRPEGRVGGPVLARQRAGVRDGGSLGLVAPADLDGQDRLAHLERPIGQGQEPLRPADALDEEHDGGRLGVLEAVGEVVAEVDDDLRAGADDATPADPVAVVEEGVGDAARTG